MPIERRTAIKIVLHAPGVAQALPTHEHFAPVVAALGAAADTTGPVAFPITGFLGGSLTRRSVQFG